MLMRKIKARKKDDSLSSTPPSSQGSYIKEAGPSPNSCRLLQPRGIRALEKDLKEKTQSSQWDFSTYYRGNVLHVSFNSDSDESSVDSLEF